MSRTDEDLLQTYNAQFTGGFIGRCQRDGLRAVYDLGVQDGRAKVPPEPEPIDPADIRVGMRVRAVVAVESGETVTTEARVVDCAGSWITLFVSGPWLSEHIDWYLLAPAPDPDAPLIEAVCGVLSDHDDAPAPKHVEALAARALAALRTVADVTPRAES